MTQDTRKDPRAKIVSLNVRYKSATVDEFIENHSHDVSKGGIFIKTSTPFAQGTLLKFEIRLAGDQAVIAGVGRVVWKREPSQASAERPGGMGVKFIKIDENSRAVIDRLVSAKEDAGSAFTSELKEPLAALRERTTSGAGQVPGAKVERPGKSTIMGMGSLHPENSPTTSAPRPAAGNPPEPRAPVSTSTPKGASGLGAPKAGGFFPATQSELEMPPPEERTMMKQAEELLEEALKGAGGSMEEVGNNPLFASSKPVLGNAPRPLSNPPPRLGASTPPPSMAKGDAIPPSGTAPLTNTPGAAPVVKPPSAPPPRPGILTPSPLSATLQEKLGAGTPPPAPPSVPRPAPSGTAVAPSVRPPSVPVPPRPAPAAPSGPPAAITALVDDLLADPLPPVPKAPSLPAEALKTPTAVLSESPPAAPSIPPPAALFSFDKGEEPEKKDEAAVPSSLVVESILKSTPPGPETADMAAKDKDGVRPLSEKPPALPRPASERPPPAALFSTEASTSPAKADARSAPLSGAPARAVSERPAPLKLIEPPEERSMGISAMASLQSEGSGMSTAAKKSNWLVWGGIAVVAAGALVFFFTSQGSSTNEPAPSASASASAPPSASAPTSPAPAETATAAAEVDAGAAAAAEVDAGSPSSATAAAASANTPPTVATATAAPVVKPRAPKPKETATAEEPSSPPTPTPTATATATATATPTPTATSTGTSADAGTAPTTSAKPAKPPTPKPAASDELENQL